MNVDPRDEIIHDVGRLYTGEYTTKGDEESKESNIFVEAISSRGVDEGHVSDDFLHSRELELADLNALPLEINAIMLQKLTGTDESMKSYIQSLAPLEVINSGFQALAIDVQARHVNVNKIPFRDMGLTKEQALALIKKLGTNLTFASFEDFALDDIDLKNIIAWCPNLKEINLFRNGKITHASLTQLQELTHLKKLDLRGCNLEDRDLSFLGHLRELEELDLSVNRNITHASLTQLQELTHLKKLDLRGCNLEDEDLSFLGHLRELEELNLSDNENITHASLTQLQELTHLKKLDLSGCNLEDRDLSFLGHLAELEVVNVHLPLFSHW